MHIGYHKFSNVQQTRYYVPARNLWGAMTERLTRRGFKTTDVIEGNYGQVGEWVKDHLAFTYFFLLEGKDLLWPRFTEDRLCYGDLSEYEFERRYLSSHVTTALEAETSSAEQNSLHEVEFVAERCKTDTWNIHRTQLRGVAFLDNVASQVLGDKENWKHWLNELQVGGERRYGFGKIRLSENGWTEAKEDEITFSNYAINCHQPRPTIDVAKGESILAHTVTTNVLGKGSIEPLVGRETDTKNSQAFGHNLTRAKICWAPGTVLDSPTTFQINREGLWEQTSTS
jgi:hypothetical protein